jgi:hypothetical protein
MACMRWAPALLLGCVGLAACSFRVSSIDGGSIVGGDLGVVADLAPVGGADMTGGACASCPGLCIATTSPPSCQHLVPTGPVVRADFEQPGISAQTVTSDIVVDTETGAITGGVTRPAGSGVIGGVGFRVAAQPSGPSVGVFSVAGLTVAKSATITFTGANAFALASMGALTIHGTINGTASTSTAGPGGSDGGTTTAQSGSGLGGGAPGAAGALNATSGGGGAGFGDSGGQGAAGIGLTVTAGGGIYGDLTLADFTLLGGSGGGVGGARGNGMPGGFGGGGGGALQFSVDGDIVIDGVITAGGGGGRQGGGGGGGGGSGGAIVLEGAHVHLVTGAVIAANGGGGGGGAMGGDGGNGNASTVPAAGGASTAPMSSGGGAGGASNGHPGLHFTQGVNAPVLAAMDHDGGGGGGGCGRIALRALMMGIDDQSLAVTPDLSDTNSAGGSLTSYGLSTFK